MVWQLWIVGVYVSRRLYICVIITGLQQIGGQYVGEHFAAESAHVFHDGRVNQLDADGQRVEVRVHFFHQISVQFVGGFVAPDQRPNHGRGYAVPAAVRALGWLLLVLLLLLVVITGYRVVTVRRPHQWHTRHQLVSPRCTQSIDQPGQVQFQASHRVPV